LTIGEHRFGKKRSAISKTPASPAKLTLTQWGFQNRNIHDQLGHVSLKRHGGNNEIPGASRNRAAFKAAFKTVPNVNRDFQIPSCDPAQFVSLRRTR
jgi:hypothetical protein